MKTKIIILGCGSSVGVPRIDGFWGNCDKKNKRNYRSRCSAIVVKGKNHILIDTSPDLRQQLLSNNIKNISSVIYTHEHGDQTHGINDLRPFFWKSKKKIKAYASINTIKYLKKSFSYCFKNTLGYEAILNPFVIKKKFSIGVNKEKINFKPIEVNHGRIKSLGFIFENTAYISDCNDLLKKNLKFLKKLNLLIIDCLRLKKHRSHFNLNDVLSIVDSIKPKKTILTNLHSDLDYNFLLNNLPRNVKPAYDGLKITL